MMYAAPCIKPPPIHLSLSRRLGTTPGGEAKGASCDISYSSIPNTCKADFPIWHKEKKTTSKTFLFSISLLYSYVFQRDAESTHVPNSTRMYLNTSVFVHR